jgi:hypothetical protein
MSRQLLPLLLILGLSGAQAAQADLVTALLSTGEDEIRELRVADLTGDGVDEIIAFTSGAEGAGVHVFDARPKGPGPHAALAVLRPAAQGHQEVYFACLARLVKGQGAEIVLVDRRRGVNAFRLVPNAGGTNPPGFAAPRKLGPAPELPFYPEKGSFPVLDAAMDLDGDGVEELVLPCSEGHLVLRPGGEPLILNTAVTQVLETPAHRFMTLGFTVSRPVKLDWDGDGRADLAAVRRGVLVLHLQREDRTFLRVSRPVDVLRKDPASATHATPLLGDVDHDGRTDLLLTLSPSTVGLFERFTSRQLLFLSPHILSPETPGRLATPSDIVKTEGISINPTLTDYDGDGDLDLLVTSLGLDMKSRIRKSVSADYLLFRFDEKERKFEHDPWLKVSRPFPMAQLERNSTAKVCFFTGDFDGDGKKDLLNIADQGHLTIQRGTTDTGLFSSARYDFKDYLFRARAAVQNDVVVTDLDGDGTSDLVAHDEHRIYLVRSRR